MGLVDATLAFSHELVVARVPFEAPEPGQLGREKVDERVLLEQGGQSADSLVFQTLVCGECCEVELGKRILTRARRSFVRYSSASAFASVPRPVAR